MRDFTYLKYEKLCEALLENNFKPKTILDYFTQKETSGKYFVMRHDVDKKPLNSLEIAKIENRLGISSTFYFRTTKDVFIEDIIQQISNLGHEIGYHYEVLALFNGDRQKAIKRFKSDISKIGQLAKVKSISRHGSPGSKWDEHDLWSTYNYLDFGIECEAYIDIDYDSVHYVTDTGRCWNGDKFNIRDKVFSNLEKLDVGNTTELINSIKVLDKDIIINTHPQRWNDNYLPWFNELWMQNTKNIFKGLIKKYRNARS